jgi:hypothetical protein
MTMRRKVISLQIQWRDRVKPRDDRPVVLPGVLSTPLSH